MCSFSLSDSCQPSVGRGEPHIFHLSLILWLFIFISLLSHETFYNISTSMPKSCVHMTSFLWRCTLLNYFSLPFYDMIISPVALFYHPISLSRFCHINFYFYIFTNSNQRMNLCLCMCMHECVKLHVCV